MKKNLLKIAGIVSAICLSANVFAQTAGTLTFSFTPVAKSPCYQSTRWVLAAWIESNAGTFIKTRLKYCCHGSTTDHLPTWSVNAGGTAGNCSAANATDATTGATLSSFTSQSFTWDGKTGPATSATLTPDGVYKVMIQETWNHGTGGTATTTYTFTKGPTAVTLNPANTTNITGAYLNWLPTSTTGIEESASGNMNINVYPNPNNSGIVNVDFERTNNIKVINTLGMVVYNQNIDQSVNTTSLDLSSLANGVYFIYVADGDKTSKHKVILNK
jgi:hypothetical protein